MTQRRNTKQRQLILDAIRVRCDHPSAEQIYLDVQEADNKMSRGTVYRNLNILVQQGQILQVELPPVDRFEAQANRHYHLVCTTCGCVCDMPLSYQIQLDEQMAKTTGYIIKEHSMVFKGICLECQQKK